MVQREELYTVQEVMGWLQVSDESIYRYIRRGHLKAVKVGYLWRVRKTALDAFLEMGGVPNATD